MCEWSCDVFCPLSLSLSTTTLLLQMHLDGWESVQVQIREKKKWKKYPCAVRGNSFVQFKDNKVCTHTHTHTHTVLSIYIHTQCTHEVARLPVTELDVFVGMERTVRTDNKNPLPTK